MADVNNETTLATYMRDTLYRCVGFNDVESSARLDALNYYFMRPRGDEEAGASKVISGDLSAMVDATLAQMTEAFATDAIAEFGAYDKDDEHQARLETEVVQDQLMGANNGLLHLITAMKEGLLFRLAVMKIWDETFERSKIKDFNNVPNREALAAFSAVKLPPNVKIDVLDFNLDEGTARIRETITFRNLRIMPLSGQNFLYLENEETETDLQRRRFVAERHIETRSKLVERGFEKSKVDKLSHHISGRTAEAAARVPGQTLDNLNFGVDKSQDIIEWFEIYALIDKDGDGIAERWRISLHATDNVILEQKPVELVPYAVGNIIINPHKLRGLSLYDKLKQTQDIRTGLKRALLDNATAVNQGRVAYLDGKVNVDDLDSRRADRSIRVSGVADVNQAFTTLQIPDLTQGLLQNIQNERQDRAEMGGAALEMATGQLRLNERLGSMGLDRAYSVMEQLSAHMTLVIALTLVRSMFLLAHETIRKNFTAGEIVFKQSNRWKHINPSQWPLRSRLNLKIAKSPNERTRRSLALEKVMAKQTELAAQGMDEILVNLDAHYHAIIDWTRANDLPNPEKYWVDPLSEESIKAREIKTQATEQEKDNQDRLMSMAVELEQMRIAFEKYQQDTQLQFDYWNAVLQSEVEEAKIVGNATVDLLTARNKEEKPKNEPKPEDTTSETDTE